MSNPREMMAKKIELISELVDADLSNGKHAYKKLRKMIKSQGKCPTLLCEQIKALKQIGK